jgi:hypothetical protein
MWTPAIVMRKPFKEHMAEVTLVEQNQPVQALAPNVPIARSQNALACGDRTGVLRTVRPIAATERSKPSESMLS